MSDEEWGLNAMGLLSTAVGAVVAAILEVSVLAQLQLGGIRPDLVLAIGIGVAMTMGFDAGMTWAFTGGLLLDVMLPERPIGSTTLAMLLAIGLAVLVARLADPPRLALIGVTAFGAALLFLTLARAILAMAAGIGMGDIVVSTWAISALLTAVIAMATAWAIRSIALRFGAVERLDW
ncbi:MAG: hypothetical protein KF809_00820 [Chloroflexi bacterium]|nr:hypothetical protein [Chloroflexota bacterium]